VWQGKSTEHAEREQGMGPEEKGGRLEKEKSKKELDRKMRKQ
jgi:hypothetical protein